MQDGWLLAIVLGFQSVLPPLQRYSDITVADYTTWCDWTTGLVNPLIHQFFDQNCLFLLSAQMLPPSFYSSVLFFSIIAHKDREQH